jgi:hypothetical protein
MAESTFFQSAVAGAFAGLGAWAQTAMDDRRRMIKMFEILRHKDSFLVATMCYGIQH